MSESEALAVIEKLDEIILLLQLLVDWISQCTTWIAWYIGALLPGVLVLGLMWWALKQFIERYW